MSDLDLGKGLHFEAQGNITIGKVVNISKCNKVIITDDENLSDNSTSNTQVNALATTPNDPIVEDLLPIFGNDKQQVEQFLSTINGAEDPMITVTVKRLVGQGIINQQACKSPLFKILKSHNLYHASLSTWNKQV